MNSPEKNKLESISIDSPYAVGLMPMTIRHCFNILRRYLKADSKILEMGPAEGVMTEYLIEFGSSLTLVEGATSFCDKLKSRFPQAVVNNSLFEEYKTNELFDAIVMGHVLEHVEDPILVLTIVRSMLQSSGFVFAAVPNARSLHRQAGVIMGLLDSEESLNQRDIKHGHRRVFNPESFRNIFLTAGFKIDVFGGYWLKPLSNDQLEKDWSPEILSAYLQLGERYPDIAGEMYIVASRSNN